MARPAPKPTTVMDPTALTLAGAYADAAAGLCKDLEQCRSMASELDSIAEVLAQEEQFATLLAGPLLSINDKLDLISRVFGGRISQNSEALLATMARHERLDLIRPLAVKFRQVLDAREGRLDVSLTTAAEISPQDVRELEASVADLLKSKIKLRLDVDADLLGGMVIRVGDKVFDASIRQDLEQMRRKLLSRGMAQT